MMTVHVRPNLKVLQEFTSTRVFCQNQVYFF
jgi:hypothetical protein